MSEHWYDIVAANTPLTQGDLLLDCRILDWKGPCDSISLRDWSEERNADLIVMTQACDMEHNKVSNVVLCPCLPLSAYRRVWEHRMQSRNQNPSEKSWRSMLKDIADGLVWNQSLVASCEKPELSLEVQVIEFQEVFTVPRVYLEQLYNNRAKPRPRLRSPYREHLSQSFARFFMRVGLPQQVSIP